MHLFCILCEWAIPHGGERVHVPEVQQPAAEPIHDETGPVVPARVQGGGGQEHHHGDAGEAEGRLHGAEVARREVVATSRGGEGG